MISCYMHQPYPFHLNHNSAELSRNINEDVVSFFEAVLASLQFASEGSVCLALLLLLLYQDISITIGVLVLVGVFGLVFMKVFRKKLNLRLGGLMTKLEPGHYLLIIPIDA